VQPLFGEGDNKVEKVSIERWYRIWNDFMPVMTVDHREETEKAKIANLEVVRSAPKRSVYIYMMEKLGIEGAFGTEIVKAVLNNFN